MSYVLQALEPASIEGQYLEWFDLDAHAPGRSYPTGQVGFTPTLARALCFDTLEQALEVWNGQSTSAPMRPDGKPNKPLTAFTMNVMKITG